MNLIERMELLLDDPEHDGADSLVLPFADLRALIALVKAADAIVSCDTKRFDLVALDAVYAYRKLREETT